MLRKRPNLGNLIIEDSLFEPIKVKQPENPPLTVTSIEEIAQVFNNLDKTKNKRLVDNINSIVEKISGDLEGDPEESKMRLKGILRNATQMPQKQHTIRQFEINKKKKIVRDDGVEMDTFEKTDIFYLSVLYEITRGDLAGNILKVYGYDNYLFTEFVIKEIAFQKSAFLLNRECRFRSPNVIDYGFINNMDSGFSGESSRVFNYPYLFYFVMEKMDGVPLSQYRRDSTPEKIQEITENIESLKFCLQGQNLFHNDYNAGNVFVRKADEIGVDLGLIDFGESTATRPSMDLINQPSSPSNEAFEETKAKSPETVFDIYSRSKAPLNASSTSAALDNLMDMNLSKSSTTTLGGSRKAKRSRRRGRRSSRYSTKQKRKTKHRSKRGKKSVKRRKNH